MKQFKYAFKRTLPILFSYIFLGIAFGIMMQNAGYNALWSALTSLIVYTGAFQLALVGLLKEGSSIATILFTALALGNRHIFYGFSFLEDFRKAGAKFPYLVFSLTDESYALDCSLKEPKDMNRQDIEFATGWLCHCYWITGSILGGLIGAFIPFDFEGIDFCMTALFTTIFVDQWIAAGKNNRLRIPALVGLFSSVIFLIILGPVNFLLPSLITTTAILFAISAIEIKTEGSTEKQTTDSANNSTVNSVDILDKI